MAAMQTIDETCSCGAEFHWRGEFAASSGSPAAQRWRETHRHEPRPAAIEPMGASGYGFCPQCRERKFVGHGPLCVDCYDALTAVGVRTTTPTPPTQTDASEAAVASEEGLR